MTTSLTDLLTVEQERLCALELLWMVSNRSRGERAAVELIEEYAWADGYNDICRSNLAARVLRSLEAQGLVERAWDDDVQCAIYGPTAPLDWAQSFFRLQIDYLTEA